MAEQETDAEREEREAQEKKDTDATSGELGDGGKRALDAERKARRAAETRLKELEAQVKSAEDAEKTEVEKLQGQVADLTKQAEAAQAKADRFEVAAAKGLTLAQARRLVGSTKEELEEDADALRADLGLDKSDDDTSQDKKQDEDKGGRPKENLRAGASNADDEEPDPRKLADSILSSGL